MWPQCMRVHAFFSWTFSFIYTKICTNENFPLYGKHCFNHVSQHQTSSWTLRWENFSRLGRIADFSYCIFPQSNAITTVYFIMRFTVTAVWGWPPIKGGVHSTRHQLTKFSAKTKKPVLTTVTLRYIYLEISLVPRPSHHSVCHL